MSCEEEKAQSRREEKSREEKGRGEKRGSECSPRYAVGDLVKERQLYRDLVKVTAPVNRSESGNMQSHQVPTARRGDENEVQMGSWSNPRKKSAWSSVE